jgi:hypothetical protein
MTNTLKIIGKIDLDSINQRTRPVRQSRRKMRMQLKQERIEKALKRKAAMDAASNAAQEPEDDSKIDVTE